MRPRWNVHARLPGARAQLTDTPRGRTQLWPPGFLRASAALRCVPVSPRALACPRRLPGLLGAAGSPRARPTQTPGTRGPTRPSKAKRQAAGRTSPPPGSRSCGREMCREGFELLPAGSEDSQSGVNSRTRRPTVCVQAGPRLRLGEALQMATRLHRREFGSLLKSYKYFNFRLQSKIFKTELCGMEPIIN